MTFAKHQCGVARASMYVLSTHSIRFRQGPSSLLKAWAEKIFTYMPLH